MPEMLTTKVTLVLISPNLKDSGNKLFSIFPCLSHAKLYKIKVFVKLSICRHKYIIPNEEYDHEKECLASAN